MGVLGGSDVGHIGLEPQVIQSSLGCQVCIRTSLVEDNAIIHRSYESSAFQIVRSSPWGKKQELLEER